MLFTGVSIISEKGIVPSVPGRRHSYHRHAALSEISDRIVGKNITTRYLISHTIFLPMWGLQILLFGLLYMR